MTMRTINVKGEEKKVVKVHRSLEVIRAHVVNYKLRNVIILRDSKNDRWVLCK